jgi:hypothetical protein
MDGEAHRRIRRPLLVGYAIIFMIGLVGLSGPLLRGTGRFWRGAMFAGEYHWPWSGKRCPEWDENA